MPRKLQTSFTHAGLRRSIPAPAGRSAVWLMRTRPSWRPTGRRVYLRMTHGCRRGGFDLRDTETTWAELTCTHRPTSLRDTVRTHTNAQVIDICEQQMSLKSLSSSLVRKKKSLKYHRRAVSTSCRVRRVTLKCVCVWRDSEVKGYRHRLNRAMCFFCRRSTSLWV